MSIYDIEKATIWSDGFGSQGSGPNNCVTDGKFANWQRQIPSPGCLQRSGDSVLGALYSPEQLSQIMDNSPDYASFRSNLEMGPHGSVHISIGGDMAQMYSPNDPIFFMHHGYIDFLWFDWQTKAPKRNSEYQSSTSATITGFNVPISSVLNVEDLCYSYSNGIDIPDQPATSTTTPPASTIATSQAQSTTSSVSETSSNVPTTTTTPSESTSTNVLPITTLSGSSSAATTSVQTTTSIVVASSTSTGSSPSTTYVTILPGPYDRKDYNHLRKPIELTIPWISMNKYDEPQVRKYEKKWREVNEKANELIQKGKYKSKARLENAGTKDVVSAKNRDDVVKGYEAALVGAGVSSSALKLKHSWVVVVILGVLFSILV